jgi:gas vesicle protein
MAQSSGYGGGTPAVDDLSAGVTGGTAGGGLGGTTGASSASSGGGAADQAKEKASQAAGQAKEQAQQVAGQAKGRVREQIDQRSTQAGQQVRTQASDIRTVGQQLREQGKEGPAKVADQAAERIERVGNYLERADADTILDDIERFARSKPWAVVLGGVTAGFLAARGIKASSADRYQAGGASARRQIPASGRTTPGNGLGYAGGAYGGGDVTPGYGSETGYAGGGATVGGGLTGGTRETYEDSTRGTGTPPVGGV